MEQASQPATKRRLRILQVSTRDFLGGAEGSAWNLFQAYRARGHQSWLAVGDKRSADPDVLVIPNDAHRSRWSRWWLFLGTPVERLSGKLHGADQLHKVFHGIGEPQRAIEKLRGWEDFNYPGARHLLSLPPEPPDVVHCHNFYGDYFDLRVLPWLSRQRPVILNLRDAWLLSGHCAHSFDCERWRTGCGHCPYLDAYPAIRRDATAYNWQRKREIYTNSRLYITTISQWLMDKVQASMLHGVQYRVIYNGIDLNLYRPGDRAQARRALGLPDDATIVLFIAHNPFKDYATMESALRLLGVDSGKKLLFICLGREGIDKSLGQGRLVYPGFERDQNRLVFYYRAADVYIHAALDETFGKTITEAMACGIPVVATATGGIPEQIDDGQTGFLTPPQDSQAMATATRRLLANNDLCAAVGQAAAAEARRRFGLERQISEFLDWYDEIIQDWQQNRPSIMECTMRGSDLPKFQSAFFSTFR